MPTTEWMTKYKALKDKLRCKIDLNSYFTEKVIGKMEVDVLQYARQLMGDPALGWREGVRTFLEICVYGKKKGIAVLSIEEEQGIYRCLSQENFQTFRNDQTKLFRDLLEIFGLSADHINPQLFGNLSLSMMMVYKAIPNTMPFLFPELAEDMVEFQINALLDAMQRAKESGNRVKEDVQK